MNRPSLLLLAAIAATTAGCTLAPRYHRPDAPVPAQWPSGDAYAQARAADETPAVPQTGWREFFTDPKLQQVIAMALENNRDLRLASLNVELARAVHGIQRASLLPAISATGSGIKQRKSADLLSPGDARISESYDVQLGVLSWEIDFFGRIRSLKNEALEQYLATREARRSAQTLLIASVANTWLTLAADRECMALAEETLQTQQAAYDLVQRQYELGVVTEITRLRALTPVEAAKAELARCTRLAAQDENALDLLAGAPVPAELKPGNLDGVSPLRETLAGLPSEALLNRPDVLQAEGMLKAANASLGAARAAFFPRISLTSTLGTASNELKGLFDTDTDTWLFAPAAAMPIFDARVWAAHKGAKVQREMAVVQYEKAVQSAFREVADALAARGTLDTQLEAQQALVDALDQTWRLAGSRYEKGIDSYLGVLDAQRSLFAGRQGLAALRMARLASMVQLYTVLGGGAD